ncbi:MAG: hypothetical protein IK114_05400 [Fibrobacter sp.]|nr:hypothetical protein [Fibrobacter sp.]
MQSVATAYQKKYASIFFAGFALHTFASPLFGVRNDVDQGPKAEENVSSSEHSAAEGEDL